MIKRHYDEKGSRSYTGAWEREHYRLVKLGEVCAINPRLPKNTDESQNVSFLTMSSVSEKGKILSQETRVLSETKKGFTYFERGDVLLAKITPCFENGKAVYTSKLETAIGYGSTEFHVLRPLDGAAHGKYIFYLAWNDIFRFHGRHSMRGAAGQKRVTADFLKQFKIPLPPLAEQQKIAAILDEADKLRQKDQQLIDHYTTLSQSLFLEMFGDPVINTMDYKNNSELGRSIRLIGGGTPSKDVEEYWNGGIPWASVKDLKSDKLNKTVDSITQLGVDNSATKIVPKGSLIIATRMAVGKVTICTKDLAINQDLKAIEIIGGVNVFYLFYYFKSKKSHFESIASGATVKGLKIEHITKLKLTLPELVLQNQFAQHIEKIQQQKHLAQASLEKSETLFNSLLQRAFKGELTQ